MSDDKKVIFSMSGVSKTFPNAQSPVLKNIYLSFFYGAKIGILGLNGSGKSTLVSLLPRFYDVTKGEILLDDCSLQDIKLDSLRAHISLVSQDVTLFNDTVANNIAYGSLSECSEEEIMSAAKSAHALEFIEGLPEDFQTMVGDNGVLLSGGQRQRIAIARALLKNSPIIILDEATSALDNESERYIQDALSDLMKDRTTLVIAHRLSTVENADKILVLRDGEIVESGKHADLLAAGKDYAALYQMQFDSE